MKRLILMLAVVGMTAVSCKKKATNEAHCVYVGSTFISCEKTSDAATQKCIELRNQGQTMTSSTKKSKCEEC